MTSVTLCIAQNYDIYKCRNIEAAAICGSIIMNKILRFAKAELIVIFLTIFSLKGAPNVYLTLAAASLLVMIFCMESFNDEISEVLRWTQLLLSVVYCLAAGNVLSYIIFGELQIRKNKYLSMLLPSAAYICGVFAAVGAAKCAEWISGFAAVDAGDFIKSVFESFSELSDGFVLPQGLLNVLILQGVSVFLFAAEMLLEKYAKGQNKYSDIVTMAALNELYEKKLNRELVIKNYLSEQNARMEERENISRNIHNSVGHSITAAIMTLDAADMIFEENPELAREKMHVAKDRIRAGLESIRHAVRVLDKTSENISYGDFIIALNSITDNFAMDTDIRIRTDYSYFAEDIMIPHEHAEFLTGALQELLTNGVKHGRADVFTVTIVSDSSHLRMSVADNGAGICRSTGIGGNEGGEADCTKAENSVGCAKTAGEEFVKEKLVNSGFGLKKIASYVSRCGGSTEMDVENGFRFEITLPILG